MSNPRIEEIEDDETVTKPTVEEEGSDSDDGSDLEVGEGDVASGGTQIVRTYTEKTIEKRR